MTDITKIVIAAQDQASEVLARVQGSAERLHATYAKFAGLVAGTAGVGYFVHLIQQTMEAADQIEKLSQKTGIAVKSLSELDYVAKLNNVSTEDFARGIKTLATRMVEANDTGSKMSGLMKALGVDIHGGPEKAVEALADKFALLEDGTTKTALATALFGKNGMALIPMLDKGAEGIRKQREEAQRLGLAYGPEFAAAASQFNDNMKAIGASSQALGIALVNTVGQGLVNITGAMKEALIEGGKLKALWIGLGGIASNLFTDFDLSAKQKLQKTLNELTEDVKRYQDTINSARGQGQIIFEGVVGNVGPKLEEARKRIQEIGAELAKLNAQDDAAALAGKKADDERASAAKKLEAQLRALLAPQTENNAAINAGTSLMVKLQQQAESLNEQLEGQSAHHVENKTQLELQKHQYTDITDELREQIKKEAEKVDLLRQQAEHRKFISDENQKELDFATKTAEQLADLVDKWADHTEQLQLEEKLIGLSNVDREKALLLDQRRIALNQARGDLNVIREINENYEKQIASLDRINALQQQLSVWNQLADAGARFFDDILVHGKSAIESLRELFKQLLSDLVSLFARRWILQIGASLTGSSALGAAAASAGQGTISGALSNWLGSTAIGSAFTGGAEGLQMGFLSGVASPTAGYMETFGAALRTMLPILGYFSIALGGAAIAASQFAQGWRIDGNRNSTPFSSGASGVPGAMWMATQMDSTYRALGLNDRWAAILSGSSLAARIFGRRARQNDAYGISGSIGGDAATGGNWQDWSEQGGWFSSTRRGTDLSPYTADQEKFWKSFMAGLTDVTQNLADMLKVNLTDVLKGYTHDFNLQLNENGKPLDDATINTMFSTLFGTVLQEQVGMIFDAAGKGKLADYVKALTGTGDEITAKIHELVDVMGALQHINLHLDVESLMAWQQGTETLTQAFQRVASQISQFDDAFMTDAQKLQFAQASVVNAFAQIGVAVPQSNQAFYDLVHGLDLTTESGRHMFDVLMSVAPAFLQVGAAADQASQALAASMDAFDQLMGSIRPGYSTSLAGGQLDSSIHSFIAANSWAQGMSNQDFLAQLRTITREDFSHYSADNQRLILSILGLDHTLNGTTSAITENTAAIVSGPSASGRSQQEIDFENYYRNGQARQGLRGWLDSVATNSQLTTLDPMGRLHEAERQWRETLGLAQGGDPTAMGNLQGSSQTYLQIAREMFGSSSQYVDIFRSVFDSVAGVADAPDLNERIATASEKSANSLEQIHTVLMRIADGQDALVDTVSTRELAPTSEAQRR